ncbi:MAG: hypothetical protein ACJ786_12815 [Catenulispora sp.]
MPAALSDTALVPLGLLFLFALELCIALALTGGHFYYSLDDPYIHLAVSEQIRALSYGLNPGEASTPSSSLLWPFLLAVTAGTPIHEVTPLLLSISAAVLTAMLLLRLTHRIAGAETQWLNTLTVLLIMAGFNWVGVVFTGMEHSAHVAAALAVGVGLVESLERPSPWWLYAAIILNPLLRYEGLAVSFAGVMVLAWRGQRRAAVLLGVASVLPIVLFSMIAVHNGLDPLPSSVLVKSAVLGKGASPLGGAVMSVLTMIKVPAFAGFVTLVIVHIVVCGRRSFSILHVYALTILIAQAVAGRAGLGRYELYVYAAVLPVVAHLFRPKIAAVWQRRARAKMVLALAAIVFTATTIGYLKMSATMPLASRNVFLQQAQMARFAADYWPDPVAANDIGLVSYRDDDYVLDLWGLANTEARRARGGGTSQGEAAAVSSGAEATFGKIAATSEGGSSAASGEWMRRLADEHSVTVAMIYDTWFTSIPPQWEPVARLSFTGPNINSGGAAVTFYSTSGRNSDRLRAALEQFKVTLPPGATLVPITTAI